MARRSGKFEGRQSSFVLGEVSPAVAARTDMDSYGAALQLCRNYIVLAQGGITNRPGFELVGEVKDSSRTARLLPFVFASDEAYVLEVGDLYARVFAYAARLFPDAGGDQVEIVLPYLEEQLRELNHTQSADILTVAHTAHVLRNITRAPGEIWGTAEVTFVPTIAAPIGAAATGAASDGTNPVKEYEWVITAVAASGEESYPSAPAIATVNMQVNKPATVTWNAVTGAVRYNVYRGRTGAPYGFVGAAEGRTTFDDDNFAAVYSEAPPSPGNPFEGGNNPGFITEFEQRLVAGGSTDNPQTIYTTQSANRINFKASNPPRPDDAIEFRISSGVIDAIRGLVPLRVLIVLTAGSEWRVQGAGGEPIEPGNVDPKPYSYNGAAAIAPLVAGNTVLYVQAQKRSLRDLYYALEEDGYKSDDLSILADHLFKKTEIVTCAYAKTPFSVVWVVLADGRLLGLTFLREHDIWAWHQHTTDGYFEDVCVVPENNESAVYVIVRRTINGQTRRYIERMASRLNTDPKRAVFLDCALTYDGAARVDGTSLTVSNPSETDADGNLPAGATAAASTPADVFVPSDLGGSVVVNGIVLTIDAVIDARNVTVIADGKLSPDFIGSPIESKWWGIGGKAFRGLEHLEGKWAGVLADGDEHPDVQVIAGAVTLQYQAVVVNVGLPYVSRAVTLGGGQGGVRERKKAVAKVSVDVENTRILRAGQLGSKLEEVKVRPAANLSGIQDPTTGNFEVSVTNTWDKGAAVVLEHSSPMACTILAVTPEFNVGG